jgi:hypothetical protein
MADESHVIRGINWRETFPFTQIFRAFRVAIHPTKLILGLVALLALYAGGRILDQLWPVQYRAVPAEVVPAERAQAGTRGTSEVELYESFGPGGRYTSFEQLRKARRDEIENQYVALLRDSKIQTNQDEARKLARSGSGLGQIKDKLIEERNKAIDEAAKARDEALKTAKTPDDRNKSQQDYDLRVRDIIQATSNSYAQARMIGNQGIFIQFFNYEVAQVNNVVWAVLANDWLTGFGKNNPTFRNPPGVFKAISNFCVTGPWWLVRYHTWFFILFVILFSIVWAIFGGAIARIAAVHVARDEKLSLSNAVRFSTGKFLSFIFAPIIPLLIVLVVGLVVTVGALIGKIPWIGPILVGLFFFLALAAGFVMTLVLLGTFGGFNLMYPTIAVEGSDSFDAISRSFSYVYARPWRMLFYTLIAVLYGALCFLFVRFFIQIMLILTHHFVGAGMFSNVDGARIPLDLWNTMWSAPETHGFTYSVDWLTLGGGQSLAAALVAFWVYLTVGMLGAFAISFYFSANTIIYYLMRRDVDATELDDVYLEQSEEDFGDTAPAVATSTTTVTTTTVVTPNNGGAPTIPASENPPTTP